MSATRSFAAASLIDKSGYPPVHNWGPLDTQPMDLPSPTAHIKVTQKLLPDFLGLGVDMLIQAGYVEPDQKVSVISRLQNMYEERLDTAAELLCDGNLLPVRSQPKILELLKAIESPASKEDIANSLLKTGVIDHSLMGIVAERLKPLPTKPFIHLENTDPKIGGVDVYWRVKKEGCAYKKMHTDNKAPGEMGDYFGMRFVPATGAGAAALRGASLTHNMTSRKCELSVPSKEIFFSHKSHNQVSRDGLEQRGEYQIIPAAMVSIEPLTHQLKDMERNMKELSAAREANFSGTGKPDPKVLGKVAQCEEELRQIRIYINGTAAIATGLIGLALPEHQKRIQRDTKAAQEIALDVSPYTEKLLDLVKDRFPGQVEGFLGSLSRNASRVKDTSATAWNVSAEIH